MNENVLRALLSLFSFIAGTNVNSPTNTGFIGSPGAFTSSTPPVTTMSIPRIIPGIPNWIIVIAFLSFAGGARANANANANSNAQAIVTSNIELKQALSIILTSIQTQNNIQTSHLNTAQQMLTNLSVNYSATNEILNNINTNISNVNMTQLEVSVNALLTNMISMTTSLTTSLNAVNNSTVNISDLLTSVQNVSTQLASAIELYSNINISIQQGNQSQVVGLGEQQLQQLNQILGANIPAISGKEVSISNKSSLATELSVTSNDTINLIENPELYRILIGRYESKLALRLFRLVVVEKKKKSEIKVRRLFRK